LIQRITIVERDLIHLADYHEETVDRTDTLEKATQSLSDLARANERHGKAAGERISTIERRLMDHSPMSLLVRLLKFIGDKALRWLIILTLLTGYLTGKISWAHLVEMMMK
jgi:hypothetical protein